MTPTPQPPKWVLRLLRSLHPSDTLEEVEGDLEELYAYWLEQARKKQADFRYVFAVLSVLPPFVHRRKAKHLYSQLSFLSPHMIGNYLTIAFRNLVKNKAYSFINMGGLAVGMAVAMLIGLWIWDELSFDTYHKNYDRIAQVWQFVNFDGKKASYNSLPIPLAEELRQHYPDVKAASVSSYPREVILAIGNQKFSKTGLYVEPIFPQMLPLNMRSGTLNGLNDISSILLSESLARTLFGRNDALGKVLTMGNARQVTVTGVYEDFPYNCSFREVVFLAPWALHVANDDYARRASDQWDENSFQLFVQLQAGVAFEQVSAKIKDIRMKREDPPAYKPEFFLHPMSKWHLYGDFDNGVNTGGRIGFVWLFGIVGVFVLLLACINFMNLSTARSEKRAKEVGIRKTLGSIRRQLVTQFLSESLLIVILAFILSLLLVFLALPYFNEIADKKTSILWINPLFWVLCLGFCLLTGFIAGSYPAMYLSSFQPLKVLKGTFKAGRFASLPRKVLVVFQFSVSISLVIGIMIVFRQIEHAKDRPIGYNRQGLIEIRKNTPELHGKYTALKQDLLNTGAVAGYSQSMGSITDDYGGTTAVSWPGKKPDMHPLLMVNRITHDYGKTIGWQLLEGRDFSEDFATDSSAMIVNESALKLMGLENPIGVSVSVSKKGYRIIGIIADMIKDNPFKPVKPSLFILDYASVNVINIRLSQAMGIREALRKVESVFKKHNPASPFEYRFVDELYAQKFAQEEQIGKLAAFFATLATFISCLGLFGLASFMAEQRTKEIGVRKVLGASVQDVWLLLSKDFVQLVIISLCIAVPVAYYFLYRWLENYSYRTSISPWIFAVAGGGAILLTLLTVSFQAIKAALMNPVKSLRNE